MTFQLDAALHARLKTAAAQGGVTVRELLIEGAELALERRESRTDLETLKTRSAAAKACAGGAETRIGARSGYAARCSAAFSGG